MKFQVFLAPLAVARELVFFGHTYTHTRHTHLTLLLYSIVLYSTVLYVFSDCVVSTALCLCSTLI